MLQKQRKYKLNQERLTSDQENVKIKIILKWKLLTEHKQIIIIKKNEIKVKYFF